MNLCLKKKNLTVKKCDIKSCFSHGHSWRHFKGDFFIAYQLWQADPRVSLTNFRFVKWLIIYYGVRVGSSRIYSNVELLLVDVKFELFLTHLLMPNTSWAWCVNNKWWMFVTTKRQLAETCPSLIYSPWASFWNWVRSVSYIF